MLCLLLTCLHILLRAAKHLSFVVLTVSCAGYTTLTRALKSVYCAKSECNPFRAQHWALSCLLHAHNPD